MKANYRGIELETYHPYGLPRFWDVREVSTGLNVTVVDAPRLARDAIAEAKKRIDQHGLAFTKAQIKKALADPELLEKIKASTNRQ